MEMSEIRIMTDEQLLDAIEDKKEELWVLRRNLVSGEVKDTNLFRWAKRDIARLKTVQRERQLAAQTVAEKGE